MAAFECPTCQKFLLEIVESVDLGPDDDDDERSLQRVTCRGCGLVGAALYTEERRGSDARWRHYGFVLDDIGRTALVDYLAARRAGRAVAISRVHDLVTPISSFTMRMPERS